MSAYVIVDVKVRDVDKYEAYKQLVQATVEAYGGRYLARGGRTRTLEGDWSPTRLVILEFEDVERARAWWASEEYREPKALRQAVSDTQMVVVEGV